MTRENATTRDWLGLPADADEAQVRATRARLEEFLADAPPELAGWAARQTGDRPHAMTPTRPAPGARGRRRFPVVPLGVTAAALTLGVLVYNMPDTSATTAVAGQNPTASASAPADAMHGAAAASQTPPPLDQAKVDSLLARIEANPTDRAALRELANEYSRAAHFEKASQTQAKILALDPSNVDARLALGVAHFNKGDRAAAEKEWNTVLEQDPKSVEAYYDLGFLYFTAEPPQIDKAEAAWRKVVEIDPTSDVAKTVSTHLDSFKKSVGGTSTSPTAVPTAGSTQG